MHFINNLDERNIFINLLNIFLSNRYVYMYVYVNIIHVYICVFLEKGVLYSGPSYCCIIMEYFLLPDSS